MFRFKIRAVLSTLCLLASVGSSAHASCFTGQYDATCPVLNYFSETVGPGIPSYNPGSVEYGLSVQPAWRLQVFGAPRILPIQSMRFPYDYPAAALLRQRGNSIVSQRTTPPVYFLYNR